MFPQHRSTLDMALFTITDAEKVYQRDTVARTAYNRFSKAVLQELCEKNGIIAVNTGLRSHVPTKPDYIKALLFFASDPLSYNSFAHLSAGQTLSTREAQIAGGRR